MQFSQKFVGHLCPSGWKRLFLHFHSSHIFFPLLSIMECYKPNRWRMFYFPYPPMHSTRIVFASFRNLANVLHDYQSIQVGSFSWMVSILVVLNQVFCDNNLVIKERQFVRMLHVTNEVTTDISQETFVGLEDVLKTSSRHVLKTSSTRLQRNNLTSSKTT